MKKQIFLQLILLIFASGLAWSQQATLSLSNTATCDSTSVTASLTAENLFNVGAMTLEIAFDTTVLNYVSVKNIHPSFAGIFFNVQYVPQPKITIIYANMAGTNLSSGILLDIDFFYKDGMSNLTFLPSCELTTPQFQNIDVDYFDGLIQHEVIIEQQPVNQIVHQPDQAVFAIETQSPLSYQWQISYNGGASFSNLNNSTLFQGVNTNELTLNYTNSFLNSTNFRCKISSENCSKYSEKAILTVLPPLLSHEILLNEGWNSLSTYVEPVSLDLDALFSDIQNQLIILIEGENIYYPEGNLNTIGDFDPKSAYVIKVNANTTLTFTGMRQAVNSVQVPEGWSYLPVLSECEVSSADLFKDMNASLEMLKEIAGTKCYWPVKNISTLDYLQPGKAYLIKLKTPAKITFPACN